MDANWLKPDPDVETTTSQNATSLTSALTSMIPLSPNATDVTQGNSDRETTSNTTVATSTISSIPGPIENTVKDPDLSTVNGQNSSFVSSTPMSGA
jgi:hypothetical protein